MSMEKTIKLFDSEFKKDSVKITPFEARKLLELELVYWDRDQSSPYKARVLVFKYPNHYYQYKESGITNMLKSQEELDKIIEKHSAPISSATLPYQYNVVVNMPMNDEKIVDLVTHSGVFPVIKVFDNNEHNWKYRLDKEQLRISECLLASGKKFNTDITSDDNGYIGWLVDNVTGLYDFYLDEDGGVIRIKSCNMDATKDFVVSVTFNFNLIERKSDNSIKESSQMPNNYEYGESTSGGSWHEPEKVKAIRETIEAVMKNTGKTDLKDIDLDMLSSCINATFNRKKMFYKWFDEYVNGSDCSEEERSTACEFLDWVFLHKIDGDKTGDLYFKE